MEPTLPNVSAPTVSVIVPVYKTEKYLGECIESILNQTFKDFEMILVDDGSPDDSGKICDDYAAQDSRIRVFHKKNGGVASARNLGLAYACGEWIAFVDSDDWLGPECLLELSRGLEEGVSICAGGNVSVFSNKNVETRFRDECVQKEDVANLFLREEEVPFWAPWAKFFRNPSKLGKTIRFREGICYAEDWIFLLDYLAELPGKIKFTSSVSYFYRRYNESSSAQYFGFSREMNFYRKGVESLRKVVPCVKGWCWSWQASLLLFRVFPCLDFRNKTQRVEFERELRFFREFFNPKSLYQQISKILLVCRFYRTLMALNRFLFRIRHFVF